MKRIFCISAAALLAASAYSQSLRVSFNGTKDFQVKVDGKIYNSSSYLNNDLVLNNLSGQHSVDIYRLNRNGRSKQLYSSRISLSPNQEVHLTVNNNGSIAREETSSNAAYGYRTPMSNASFDIIYRDVNNKWGQSAKMNVSRDAFNTGSNYFSTDQIRELVELMNSEANRLELLKLAYDNTTDQANFYLLYDLLRSQAARTELDNFVKNYGYGSSYGNYKVAMTDASFNQLYQGIVNQRNTSGKLSAATKALNTSVNYFSVEQVNKIIALVTGENNKLQLAKLSLENIVDPENLTQLFNSLTTQAAKEDLDHYIRNNGYAGSNYNYSVRVAMTDAEFTNLYNEIRKKWLPLSKYSTAVEVFSSSTNYFTTQQVRQIVGLLSSESNRLELAKLSYDNIVDQQNFKNLYDLFGSQASKDELDEFVRASFNY